MTTPELPPLPEADLAGEYFHDSRVYNVADVNAAVEARERILIARVERLELTVQELGLRNADLEAHIKSLEAINENNLAEAAARIVDLEAVLSETVALYGKPGGPWNITSDPGGWLERARAAIDAARGAN